MVPASTSLLFFHISVCSHGVIGVLAVLILTPLAQLVSRGPDSTHWKRFETMRFSWTVCALGALLSRAAAQASPGTTPQATPASPDPQPTPPPPAEGGGDGYGYDAEPIVSVSTYMNENFYMAAACTNTALCTVYVTEEIHYTTILPGSTVSTPRIIAVVSSLTAHRSPSQTL